MRNNTRNKVRCLILRHCFVLIKKYILYCVGLLHVRSDIPRHDKALYCPYKQGRSRSRLLDVAIRFRAGEVNYTASGKNTTSPHKPISDIQTLPLF